MKSLQPISWLFGLILALPVGAAPEVWIGTIPAHTTVCTPNSMSRSDSGALAQAGQELLDHWPGNRTGDLGSLLGREGDTPDAILVCAQYFGGDAPPPGGYVIRPAPASPGLFAYCSRTDSEGCLTRVHAVLGEDWHGERWSRPRYDWVKPGTAPAVVPPHAELELLAVAVGPRLTPPDAESELQQVGQLTVARLTEDEANRIRADLTRPPVTPVPPPTPAAAPEQPPLGEPR